MAGALCQNATGQGRGNLPFLERQPPAIIMAALTFSGWRELFDHKALRKTAFVPALVAAGFLLLAASSLWPYAFYVLLRVTVCAIGLYLARTSFLAGKTMWVWVFGAVAVVFNPILPMRMHRSDWSTLNVIAAGIFIVWVIASIVRDKKGLG